MQIRILGSAAGGGVPQWNCRCSNCAAVRAGSPHVRPRTQSSVAISADGRAWFLLNVSPDIRQQILAFPALGPPEGSQRGQCIVGCVLTDAELDHTAGLLLLREGDSFCIFSTSLVRRWLNRYLPVEPLLACFSRPRWIELLLDQPLRLPGPDGTPSGLLLQALEIGGHVPRFVTDESGALAGSVVGLFIKDLQTGGTLVYAPCVASLSEPLLSLAKQADGVLIDGTFWEDAEPIQCGIGSRTARAMGHLPVYGPEGSLRFLSELTARHRIYIHINNTNPMLNEHGAEHRLVTSHGVQVGADGDRLEL